MVATHSDCFLPSSAGAGQPFGGGQKLLKKAMTRELLQQELLCVIYIQPHLTPIFWLPAHGSADHGSAGVDKSQSLIHRTLLKYCLKLDEFHMTLH